MHPQWTAAGRSGEGGVSVLCRVVVGFGRELESVTSPCTEASRATEIPSKPRSATRHLAKVSVTACSMCLLELSQL